MSGTSSSGSDRSDCFVTTYSCGNCGNEWDESHPSRTVVEKSKAVGSVVVRSKDCDHMFNSGCDCCYPVFCPVCDICEEVLVADRERSRTVVVMSESGATRDYADRGHAEALRQTDWFDAVHAIRRADRGRALLELDELDEETARAIRESDWTVVLCFPASNGRLWVGVERFVDDGGVPPPGEYQ